MYSQVYRFGSGFGKDMALLSAEALTTQFQGFSRLPVLRQIGLMVGLSASIALGVAVVLWSQEPNYSLLYAGMGSEDAAQIVDALQAADIPYRLEQGASAVVVPAARVSEARLKLASLGLPKNHLTGLEFLDQEQPLGTSRMIEQARYKRALGVELARTIMSLDSVRNARVHLALPKRSVFLRDRSAPSASVLLDLYPGRRLDETQIAGITKLVASSIPGLEAEQVTVVDQKGHLLSHGSSAQLARGVEQLKYTQHLEALYVDRIRDILAPLVGAQGVRAQVTASVDYTSVEQTSERYDPKGTVVRSEQLDERQTKGSDAVGIPGALSNQPPPAGTVDPQDPTQAQVAPTTVARKSTRNFEVDRTLSHTRTAPGEVKHLSVAVVVDYRTRETAEGETERVPLDAAEMERITSLVKEAVGFDAQRGDSVNVINASFVAGPQMEAPEALPLWREPWFLDLMKQAAGGLVVLVLALGVLRPTLKSLAREGTGPAQGEESEEGVPALPEGAVDENGEPVGGLELKQDQLSLSGSVEPLSITDDTEQRLEQVRTLVRDDPGRVAQVVKSWIAIEEP